MFHVPNPAFGYYVWWLRSALEGFLYQVVRPSIDIYLETIITLEPRSKSFVCSCFFFSFVLRVNDWLCDPDWVDITAKVIKDLEASQT